MTTRDDALADALRAATPDQVAAALSIPAGDVGLIGEAKIEIRWHNGAPLWRLSWRERWGVGQTLDAALEDLARRTLAGDGGYRRE